MFDRFKLDSDAYHRRAQSGPCFICGIVARDPDFPAHIVYEDEVAIAFLDKYPPLYGHTLVAPRAHREQVTADFTLQAYLDLQQRVYRIAEAVRVEVGAERMYIYALGSNQGNAHVHWHAAPLPPGVPYHEQHIAAICQDPLAIPDEEQTALAARIRRRLQGSAGVPSGPDEARTLVRRYFHRLLNERDLSVCDELLAPEYVDHDAPPGAPPGPASIREFVAGFLADYPDMRVEIEDTVAEGDRVVARIVWRGCHRTSGEALHQMGIVLLRIDERGRFVERWSVYRQL